MFTLEKLLGPISIQQFFDEYLSLKPLAQPGTAELEQKLPPWDTLKTILAENHKDCWLVKEGKLSPYHNKEQFQLTLLEAVRGFNQGFTILVRHSELVHEKIDELANSFFERFDKPVDVQLYITPTGNEGFNWHFDYEDVFVIQTSGEKEFYLRQNVDRILPLNQATPKSTADFLSRSTGPELRCFLKAGDFLYIPRGYWHKAKAFTDSFHLSVGVSFAALGASE